VGHRRQGCPPGEGGRRGEVTPASGIDILVEFREGEETFDHFMDLIYLEDILSWPADLVITDTLKPGITTYRRTLE